MGLDMEIRRIYKTEYSPNAVYNRGDVDGIIFSEEEMELDMFRQVMPYCQKIRICNQYYDMEKIRADYGLSDQSYIGGYYSEKIVMYDKDPSGQRVEIPAELVNEKYTIEKIEWCLVCKSESVRYWRKAYGIQGWFYNNLDCDVENTGFYMLSSELQTEFNKAWPDDKIEVEEPDEDSALFYWEWY